MKNITSKGMINNASIFNLGLKSRVFIQIGTGNNWASESKLHFAGANNEELMNNEFSRSTGFIPNEYLGFGSSINNFHHSGGLYLRGYAGYLVPQENNGNIESFNYSGKSGAAINLEIDLSKYFHIHILDNKLKTYIFGDAGIITNEDINKEFIKIRNQIANNSNNINELWKIKEYNKEFFSKIDSLFLSFSINLIL